ncbi:MAG TPA: DNA polymerase ligase N-terminal domain-containing protein [bacterium]
MPLKDYRKKRDFRRTPEPAGGEGAAAAPRGPAGLYVIQKHHAGHLHYDLRLEAGGVLKSWAVPKGPSLDPAEKRLAVEVEDHPLDYASFEGTIPAGEYGAGTVIVWDRGTYRPQGDASLEAMLEKGAVKIEIAGEKLRGGFALVRTRFGGKKTNWLLIKEKDAAARPGSDVTAEAPRSVLSGRDVDEIGDRRQEGR